MEPTSIVIVDRDTGRELERCAGPGVSGACPRQLIRQPVACAGRVLEVAGITGRVSSFAVPEGFTICPVVWMLSLASAASH